jgi:hypothetical protein
VRDLVGGAAPVCGVYRHEEVSCVYYCFGGEGGHDCAADFETSVWAAMDELAALAY